MRVVSLNSGYILKDLSLPTKDVGVEKERNHDGSNVFGLYN